MPSRPRPRSCRFAARGAESCSLLPVYLGLLFGQQLAFLAVGSIKIVHLTRFNRPKHRNLRYFRISIRELGETQPPSLVQDLTDRNANMHNCSPVKRYSDLDVVAWQSAPHRLLEMVEEQTNRELCASCHFECALGVSVRSDADWVRGNWKRIWI